MKEKITKCDCGSNTLHEDVVEKVKKVMPGEETSIRLAELFKVFGDTTRIKILTALLNSEMCVCDIATLLGMTHSAISHQLRVLKSSGLVRNRRKGRVVYYSLDDEHVSTIMEQGMRHADHRRII